MNTKLYLSLLVSILCIPVKAQRMQRVIYKELPKSIDSLVIREGILSQHATQIEYERNGEKVATITLSEPVKVAQAEQKEKWGFYQFPSIKMAKDSTLIVTWQMSEDSHKSYGKKSERKTTPMMSKDGGITWLPKDKDYPMMTVKRSPILKSGGNIAVMTPPAKDIRTYSSFPKPVGKYGNRSFYIMDSLPSDLQGIYVKISKQGQKTKTIHAKLNDPGLLRYAIDSLMPIVWWGNMLQLADRSLVTGVYPAYYLDTPGGVAHNGVSFYRSDDDGYSWTILSRIPFKLDGIAENREGKSFDEPAFEILHDSTFICVMRSGSKSPMYRTFSYDQGKKWSEPLPFAPNGVKPKFLQLDNGVLVLVSGRPGVQIRFSLDGTGVNWTVPIDMMPFMKPNGTPQFWLTCGYASIIEADKDSFYVVYSDFTTKNTAGKNRKSIWCRKIQITT